MQSFASTLSLPFVVVVQILIAYKQNTLKRNVERKRENVITCIKFSNYLVSFVRFLVKSQQYVKLCKIM